MPGIMASVELFEFLVRAAITLRQREKHALDVDELVQGTLPPLEEKAVSSFCSYRMTATPFGVYLPVHERTSRMRAIMRITGGTSSADPPRLRLYCTFLYEEEPLAYCFRFDSPEDKNVMTSHSYYHAQLVFDDDSLLPSIKSAFHAGTSRRYVDQPAENSDLHALSVPDVQTFSFVPDSFPAFPLPATDFAELLICVLVSLYGWGAFVTQWITEVGNSDALRRRAAIIEKRMMPSTGP